MIQRKRYKFLIGVLALLCYSLLGCKTQPKEPAIFELLDHNATGLDFSNNLSYNKDFNLFRYIYFYNGSGVGAGDFNNDGLIDLFYGANQQQNRLYLNTGALHFKDVTKEARIPDDNAWSTGISVIDINNDGLLDIYVCRVGNYEVLHSKNQLLINQGIGKDGVPTFADKAHEYGLDFSGFSTQAAFFDYDMDGDLDMFLLNHSVHENGTFRPRTDFTGTYHPLSGDRIYRNDGNVFTDVTKETGINSSAIGYGLGIAIADINLDGYPDIYIGNDFHENDYLYINQRNGTFKEEGEQHIMHTSQFTMGIDIADVNNDAYPEIISMDMLPSDPYILKRSLGEDEYNTFNYKISVGYSHQYTRNNFQYNRRNGLFSEAGLYSGIAGTDWSWSPLWMDFDNDGLKDLFISNGIPKRMNDIDYVNFVSNSDMARKISTKSVKETDISLIDKFPEIKIPNRFFHNEGNLNFTDEQNHIGGSEPTFSNGAIYADLDNDGDLDIVVNNINAPSIVYENKNSQKGKNNSLRVNLKGDIKNPGAVGAKIIVYANNGIRTYEKFPVKGFMSSMNIPLLIGLEKTKVDSMFLIWPDNRFQKIDVPQTGSVLNLNYQKGLPFFDYGLVTNHFKNEGKPFIDITHTTGINYLHKENHFVEFDREPLIPHMVSTEGPALAVSDVNKDKLDDVFVGSARFGKKALFLQQPDGKFIKTIQPAFENDSAYEDVAACWADVNNDGNTDLIVASGGNEFYGSDRHNSPRIYLNDGNARFEKAENAFENIFVTASCVIPYDFNGDGYVDLFIGGRAVPGEYGKTPESFLLLNDKTGKFKDVTKEFAKDLSDIGFVTNAIWFDMDKDGDKDLLVSLEWGGLYVFTNDKGVFTKKTITDKKGWWNFMLPCDVDNDGDIDLIAGNLGLNSRLKASDQQPVRMYYDDFDNNGKFEQIVTYYVGGKEIPFANKSELEKQMPAMKKKYLYAGDFAKATLSELFDADKLAKAQLMSANYFANAILINNGDLRFDVKDLPMEAQFSPFKDAVVIDANGDNLPDVLMVGNYYDNNIEMGRYDADFGTVLINKGKGTFKCETLNGLSIKEQARHISRININNSAAYIIARNSDSVMVIRPKKQ